jgi:hypothetical protein
MTALTLTHTAAAGTILDGTERSDRSSEVLHPAGWRWSARFANWYVPRSRGRAPSRHLIARTVQLLEEAGFTVVIEIDEAPHAADDAEQRAAATAAADAVRVEPQAVAHRIVMLETQRQKISRSIAGYRNHLGRQFPPAAGDQLIRLKDELAHVDEDLAHWTRVRAQQIADGAALVLTRDDVTPGDLVEYRGGWVPVLRVNAKSVSVPSAAGGSWAETIPYHQISGHQSKQV